MGHVVTTERQRGANDCELKGAPHAEWSVHDGRVGGKFFAMRNYNDEAGRVETAARAARLVGRRVRLKFVARCLNDSRRFSLHKPEASCP